jgi:hypothetical protein
MLIDAVLLSGVLDAQVRSLAEQLLPAQRRRINDLLREWSQRVKIEEATEQPLLDRVLAAVEVITATATPVPIPADVALFNRLLGLWHAMWNDAGRYGPAGLKMRRALIVLFALILVTFVLDAAIAQAHLTGQQLAEVTVVEGAVAVAVTVAKK